MGDLQCKQAEPHATIEALGARGARFAENNPEVRTTQAGTAITSLSLATSRSFKDADGNRQSETEWLWITCFSGTGKSSPNSSPRAR